LPKKSKSTPFHLRIHSSKPKSGFFNNPIIFLDFSKYKIQDDVTEFFDVPIFAQVFLYISKHVKKTKTLKTDAKK
jgi:hypothetical protein